MTETSVLLVDDDAEAVMSLSRALKSEIPGAAFHGAGTIQKALELQKERRPSVAVIDLALEAARGVHSGFDLLEKLSAADPAARVIVLTGHGSREHGIASMQRGAASFLEKPADIRHLAALIRDGVRQNELRRELEAQSRASRDASLSRISGGSPAALRLRDELGFAAYSGQPVHLTGESGTGKGLCAAILHEVGRQRAGKFIRYQPSFLSGDLVNSDLFGHERGAFTGAESGRKGLVEEASGGTLFLDEIDSLPQETQILLLGVLQDGRFRRVGGNDHLSSSFRLVSASNAPLERLVEKGTFRHDLFFRVAHLTVRIPPLRERKEDISELADSTLEVLRARGDISVMAMDDRAAAVCAAYDWPGNVRELQSVVEGAAYRAQFEGRFVIMERDLKLRTASGSADGAGFHDRVSRYKKTLVEEALARSGGNQLRAAKELGLDRSTLRRILEEG